MKNKVIHIGIISIFVSLYFLVATISMINSVAFFDLTHDGIMNWALAIGFELGAAASLAAIIILDKTNKTMVWGLFLLLTGFQMMANSFHAFVNLENYIPTHARSHARTLNKNLNKIHKNQVARGLARLA